MSNSGLLYIWGSCLPTEELTYRLLALDWIWLVPSPSRRSIVVMGKLRRSSAAVATSREGHRSVPGPALPLRGPSPANRWEGSHLHQKGSQKRSLGPHGRLVPAGLARPPTPVSKNRLKCGAVTASCLPPSLKIRIVVAHERTVLPSMPPLLMLPGPKSLKTVIVEAYVTLLEAHESSAAMRSSFGCILHLAPRSASISVIP
jgi:hypothetical protein